MPVCAIKCTWTFFEYNPTLTITTRAAFLLANSTTASHNHANKSSQDIINHGTPRSYYLITSGASQLDVLPDPASPSTHSTDAGTLAKASTATCRTQDAASPRVAARPPRCPRLSIACSQTSPCPRSPPPTGSAFGCATPIEPWTSCPKSCQSGTSTPVHDGGRRRGHLSMGGVGRADGVGGQVFDPRRQPYIHTVHSYSHTFILHTYIPYIHTYIRTRTYV